MTGKQKGKFKQVYDSALIKGIEKTNGVRIPQIPKTKEKFLPDEPPSGASILPQTLKEQKDETKKILKRGQVSIKITKPKLTINGFQIDKEDLARISQTQKPKQVKKSSSAA